MKKTPNLLLIETATDVCSVAISTGAEVIAMQESHGKRDHAAMLTVFLQDILQRAGLGLSDLDAIAVSAGPGSYTGLRVGIATAKALCYVHHLPLISVDTLESLCLAAKSAFAGDALYIPMIDARRMEVYAAVFDQEGQRLTKDFPLVLHEGVFEPLTRAGEHIVLSGNGTDKTIDLLVSERITRKEGIVCSARHLLHSALRRYRKKQFEDLRSFTPNYVKPPNITTSSKPLI